MIILGEDKHIPISIEFPNGDTTIKAKALIKQLTLKEMDKIKINKDNPWLMSMSILKVALLKTNGDNFTEAELSTLPMGVVTAISNEIMKASGVDMDNQLSNF